jgi:arylsulfatase A-like enzyme
MKVLPVFSLICDHTLTKLTKAIFLLTLLIGSLVASTSFAGKPNSQLPNILFIIMDDVGIDQLGTFNPSGSNLVSTPNLDTLVHQGVAFNNAWMMPECSPSRSCFFTGRWPLRTGVTAAILDYDLPVAQVSPYEVTTPKLLAHAGYTSALVGKFHLAGPDNNPDNFRTPSVLGWDYYNGNLQGGPPFIDKTLGLQTTNIGLYPYGFPVGDQRGVCWFQGPGNQIHCGDNGGKGYSGLDCITLGGIPALTATGAFAQTCAEATIRPYFTNYNGYYVWPQVINNGSGLHRTPVRQYMSIYNTDTAIQWVKGQSQGNRPQKPWMLTVAYDSIHTPYQHPPTNLWPPGFTWPPDASEGGTNAASIKAISDLMLYALDQEVGRLLTGLGLASRSPNGELNYDPQKTDTMIVVLGDNGTYYPSVNDPYDPLRSKSTPYQTGVCAPLFVSGPMVTSPGRTVTNLVNAVDMFALFGEIAGLDVRSIVPASHILDCQSVLPYLTNVTQAPFRTNNFTQIGDGAKAPGVKTWPCVFYIGVLPVGNDHLFSDEQTCEDEGGVWFGPPITTNFPTCCDLKLVITNLVITPANSWAVRNDRYKLVYSILAPCDTNNPTEFYDLQPKPGKEVGLDTTVDDLLKPPHVLTPEETDNFNLLQAQLITITNSEPVCYGDGNLDKVVDQQDFVGVQRYKGQPSVFDVNNDGVTDEVDLQCVLQNFGHNCLISGPGQPCK